LLAWVERRRELIGEIEGIDFSELADDDVRRARWSG
jgi:hypothetical protein